jgi:hypothetical protein
MIQRLFIFILSQPFTEGLKSITYMVEMQVFFTVYLDRKFLTMVT